MAGRVPVSEVLGCLQDVSSALRVGDLEAAQTIVERAHDVLTVRTAQRRTLRPVRAVALTRREETTLRCLPDGSMSQKDIARRLGVSHNTVKTHLKSLYLKLGVHCRGEAIQRARELGLLERGPIIAEDRLAGSRAPVHVFDRATA